MEPETISKVFERFKALNKKKKKTVCTVLPKLQFFQTSLMRNMSYSILGVTGLFSKLDMHINMNVNESIMKMVQLRKCSYMIL